MHDDMQTQQPQQHTHAMPSDSMPPGMSAPMHDNISAPAGSQVAAVSAPAPGSAHAQPHPMANGPVQSLPGPVQSLPIPAGGYAHGHGAKRQRDGVVIPGPVGQAGVATAGVPAPPGPAPVLPAGAQPAGIPGVPRPLGMPGQVPVSAAPQYQAGMHMPMSMSMSPGAMMSLAAMQQKRGRRATKEQKISGDKVGHMKHACCSTPPKGEHWGVHTGSC